MSQESPSTPGEQLPPNRFHRKAELGRHRPDTAMEGAKRAVVNTRGWAFPVKCGFAFVFSFMFGAAIETFACKTHMYEVVARKRSERRYEMDEFVVDTRQKMEQWTQADMAIAEEKRLREQAAKQSQQPAS